MWRYRAHRATLGCGGSCQRGRESAYSQNDLHELRPGYLMEIIEHKFYGYRIKQNPSNDKLALYMGGIDAQVLRDVVSVDNAVGWDPASGLWRSGGRNRVVIESHW